MSRTILNVQIPDGMQLRLDQLATEWGTTRSQVVRRLLETALGDDVQVQVAREAVFLLSQERKKLLAKFNSAIQEVVDDMQREMRS